MRRRAFARGAVTAALGFSCGFTATTWYQVLAVPRKPSGPDLAAESAAREAAAVYAARGLDYGPRTELAGACGAGGLDPVVFGPAVAR